MATELKLRRGTTAQHSTFTGAEAEVTVDTDKETVVVHDGTTVGGYALAREDMSNVPNDTISGDQIAGGDATFDSINVDSGTLFVDSVNNRVGIGTSSPSENLEVNGNIIADGVYLGGTGSANKLDDYEEGTWTPEYGGTTTDPVATYGRAFGAYTKIGNVVYFEARLFTTGVTTQGSGTATIKNLPFAVSNGNNLGGGIIRRTNDWNSNNHPLTGQPTASTTEMQLVRGAGGLVNEEINTGVVANNFNTASGNNGIDIWGFYYTDS